MPMGESQPHNAFLKSSAASYIPNGDCPSITHRKAILLGPCRSEQVGAAESSLQEPRAASTACRDKMRQSEGRFLKRQAGNESKGNAKRTELGE